MSTQIVDAICFEKTKVDEISIVNVNLQQATYTHAAEFKTCLEELIKLGNYKIILDFSKCQFVDSTFLGSIAVLLKALRTVSGNIKIVYTDLVIKTIMESNGIHRVIEIYESLDDALKSFE